MTLCCAPEDADHLRPLAAHLSDHGLPTSLLIGVESDPHQLGPALDVPGAGLYVVCLGESLGPAEHRRLAGVYSARKGPAHYLAELLVEPDETLAMAETIHAALAKLDQSNASAPLAKQAKSPNGSRLRDVVGVTDISAVGSDAIPGGNTRIPKTPPPSQRAPVREGSVSGSYVLSAAKSVSRERSATADDAPAPGRPAPKADASGITARTGSSPAPAAKLDATPRTASKPAVTPVDARTGRSSKSIVIVLFVVLLAVAGTVYLIDSQGPETTLVRGRGAPTVAPIDDTATATETAEPETTGQEATGDDSTTGEHETGSDDGGEAEPTDATTIIREAIANGDMRSIDLLLVAQPGDTMSWRDAANDCRAKSYRGVRDWRLPSLDELKTLRGARMLEKDRYWSGTLAPQVGDGQDHVFVLDLAARSIEPVSKDASDVRVRCVRAALQPG
ncbi:DUF1566 domain-containing protein [Enhygromyxa salina]|uniref:DUF1566 domain-containing protein n=1 Tax=Enhygromyxa salina TaxID=215803 RepID=UPI0015E6AFB6|nr:DUF1566 domain-containing protein [Enhygromyxa salina]